MSTRRKPVVGETLVRVSTGNLLHGGGGRKPEVLEVRVSSVGKKYFDTEVVEDKKTGKHHYPWKVTHCIADWRQKTEYCQDWILYESMQEFRDVSEGNRIKGELWDIFGGYGGKANHLTIAQLRRIKDILEEDRP